MHSITVIGLGGFFGAILRYQLSTIIQNGSDAFPWGTLVVNIVGSFLLSFIMYLSEYFHVITEESRLFLTVGLLGAFAKTASFSYESLKLFERGETMQFGLYALSTVMFAFLAVYLSKIIVTAIASAN